MRGEWKGLKALFLEKYPCAYYVHCMAHQLQLALVASSREVHLVDEFFSTLAFIINVVCAFNKRRNELQAAQCGESAQMLALGELETDSGPC